jgi:4-amino-4-deoxy-L-arabinose transferase-like glycosyltransferase
MGDAVGSLTLEGGATAVASDAPDSQRPALPSPPAPPSPRRSRHQFWRSPPDQPGWARPSLLIVAALAALSYGWGMNNATLETFYGAAARSMSQSWHNLFFGVFDPWGTVSLDKLPGAFWVQALSLRIFGFHTWAIVLPQVVEGALTVLVLYRAVRRVAGPGAGLAAAVALAATPVTILLNRGNISDSLLILLLVLAADATTAAFTTGRLRPLVVAGVWVGLAFQAKMLQAWLVLPALYLAYLLAAPVASLVRRLGHVALSGLVVVVVSLSWMSAVSLVPAYDRPYVDGSCDNSVFSQVFLYNGIERLSGNTLDQAGCNRSPAPIPTSSEVHRGSVTLPRGLGRFLNGILGRDADWLLVPAVVALVGILVTRRREPRTDPLRGAAVLWAAWLFLSWCFFASSKSINSYYVAAFVPPIAALCGMGLALAWRLRQRPAARAVVGGTVVGASAYALYLLPSDAGVRPWIVITTVLLTLAAAAVTVVSLLPRRPSWTVRTVVGISAAALLTSTVWASATVVAAELGPFDSPYQSANITTQDRKVNAESARIDAGLVRAADRVGPAVSVITSETSSGSSVPILVTGHEFLPVGGFTGRVQSPTLAEFVDDVRQGKVAVVLAAVAPRTRNPDVLWAIAHCPRLPYRGPDSHIGGRTMGFFVCSPADASF